MLVMLISTFFSIYFNFWTFTKKLFRLHQLCICKQGTQLYTLEVDNVLGTRLCWLSFFCSCVWYLFNLENLTITKK